MKIDVDLFNHQWIINYNGIIREVSFFSKEKEVEDIINQMKAEYRNNQLENILRKV